MYLKPTFIVLSVLFFFSLVLSPGLSMALPEAEVSSRSTTFTGTIVETMNVSGYTYMLIESGIEKTWVAIPATTVKKGETVSYYGGMAMKDYTSKTLNRTFETLVFSTGLAEKEDTEAPQVANSTDSFSAAIKAEKEALTTNRPTPELSSEVSAGSAGAIVPAKELSIEKATGANGYTVEEIFAKATELSGHEVQVRGKVVKFSPLIMGKNWLHLQDGTGDPMKNSHDLVVTTTETVAVDAIITIAGKLTAEKDFGAGYKYAAIVEDAAISK